MVLPQAMAWVQYWFRILSLKFCGKSKKICGDISPQSPAFCMYAMQYHAIPCNTRQYHASLITADGAYHCPVGSIRPFLNCCTITCLDPESEDIFSYSHKGEFVSSFKCGSGKRLISQVGTWAQPRFHFYVCDRIGIVLLSAFRQGWGRLRIGNVIITRPRTIRQVQMETQLQIHQH